MTSVALPSPFSPELASSDRTDSAPATPPLTLDAAPTGPMPALPGEARPKRALFGVLAVLITFGYFYCALTYWEPFHQGTDQNGYLVGGRQLAETLSMRQSPRQIGNPDVFDPHQFVGSMWVTAGSDTESFFPKYPVGLPLLYAICLWIGGSSGQLMAYLLSPVAMALTVAGVFVLTRQFAGSFPALLAMLVFGTSPTTVQLLNNPNSHATTVFCVVWGMIAVLHWWRFGGLAWAIVGGLLAGYATTIRYTEGALVLPVVWAAFWGALSRRGTWRSWIEAGVLVAAWALPVGLLVIHNLIEFGLITGYDGTSESTGFSWTYAADNWETLLRQMSENGLFLIFPLAIAGLVTMFWWNWRLATFLWLWAGPCVAVYTFYYWAPDGLGYMRFLLTCMPPLLVGAFWLIAHLRDVIPQRPMRLGWYWVAPALVLVAGGSAVLASVVLRIDLLTRKLIPLETYLNPDLPAYFTKGMAVVFVAMVVMIAAWLTAFAAAALLGRAAAPTVVAGIIGFLSIAVQADNSSAQLERETWDRGARLAMQDEILRVVPEGSVVVCRDSSVLNPLQFARNYLLFTGESFDRAWIDNRQPKDGPDPIDPARIKAMKETLAGFNQNALNEQARQMINDALVAKRRVFVIDSVRTDRARDLRRLFTGPQPDFIRRYVDRRRDSSLVVKPVAGLVVAPPKEEAERPRVRRGRADTRPQRPMAWQIWEIASRA